MSPVDLRPFGFTPTESLVYAALLELGPSTGYAVARAARLARAAQSIEGVLAAELWRPTPPAWRRAATRAQLDLRLAGDAGDTEGLVAGQAPDGAPTLLVIDGGQMLAAAGTGDATGAVWSSHPLLVQLAGAALRAAR